MDVADSDRRATYPRFDSANAARAWCERERASIISQVTMSADDHPSRTVRLAATFALYLDGSGLFADALVVHAAAVRAARQLGDPGEQARAHHHLGRACWRLGQLDEALTHLQLAAGLAATVRTSGLSGDILSDLGIATATQGRRADAARLFEQALEASTTYGDDVGQATALGNLGVVHKQLGRYDDAVRCFTLARDIHRRRQFTAGEAATTANLGLVAELRGDWVRRSASLAPRCGCIRPLATAPERA